MSVAMSSSMAGTVHWRSWPSFEREEEVRGLARFVRGGGVVVFPTESSYALGADPENAQGVAAVYRIKARPGGKPLPVVVANMDVFKQLGLPGRPDRLCGLEAAWPGPLTVVLPCRGGLPAASGRKELAVRIPGHRRLRHLLARASIALTATSANVAGREPLLELNKVVELVSGERALVIDQGRLQGGPPSTLVRWEGDSVTILRDGAMSAEILRELAPRLTFYEGFSADAVEIPAEEES